MYLETPVGEEERARLVTDLQNTLSSPGDKQLVQDALRRMVEADGLVSDDERAVIEEIDQAIDSVEVGVLGGLQRLVGGAAARRSAAVANAPNREAYFEDFIKNKVYYSVKQRLAAEGRQLNLTEDQLRKLSLAGGLMAKIAQLDREVTGAELESMAKAMHNYWGVNPNEAAFVAEVAVSAVDVVFDTFRMIRELATATTVEQRRRFLCVLFLVAAADGKISNVEHEEIRAIANGLNLTHKDFIDAKMQILAENR
jgi:uncharacterized tellurite resistance protein B-like protein